MVLCPPKTNFIIGGRTLTFLYEKLINDMYITSLSFINHISAREYI